MKKFISFILVLILFFAMSIPALANTNQLIEYPEYPEALLRNYDYCVSVTQGQNIIDIPVYNAVNQNEIYINDIYRRFCEFAFSGDAVTINVTVNIDMSFFEVLPSSKKLPATVSDNVISITLSNPENIVVRLNGDQNTCLSIFAESPETDVPQKENENVIYCDAGLDNIINGEIIDGEIAVPQGKTLYLAPGALVRARVKITGSNAAVKGRGSLIDPENNRTKNTKKSSYLLMTSYGLSNLAISGIKLLDARTFNITLNKTSDSVISDVKMLSNQISTDGISYWTGTNNIETKDCFLYVNDNVLVAGGVSDISVENMTIGTGYAVFFPQGTCTNVTFNNIDVFRAARLYKSSLTLSSAWTQNITISNVRAVDALKLGYFVSCSNQNSGVKTIIFENISLPQTVTNMFVISDTNSNSETKNYSFAFNNVWKGETQLTEFSNVYDESICTCTFGTDFDADAAMAGLSSKQSAEHIGDKIYVGNYLLPSYKNGLADINNTIYIDALGVLKQLGYNVNFSDNTVLFSNSKDEYSVIIDEYNGYKNTFKKILSKPFVYENGSAMMPVTALEELGISSYSYNSDAKTLKIDYIPNGENLLENSDFEKGGTLDWICYMFAALDENIGSNSEGKSLLVTPHKSYLSNDTGITQYVTDDLLKNGAGTYHLEAAVKLNTEYAYENNELIMGITNGEWALRTKSLYNTFEISDEWQKISCDFEISENDLSKFSNGYFFIGACKGTNSLKSFYVDDASLTKVISENPLKVDIQMQSGASIRLNNKNGIRFYTTVDTEKIALLKADGATVEMGTIIAPADLLDGEELTLETDSDKMRVVLYDSENYFVKDDFKGIVGSIVSIKESTTLNPNGGNIARDFIGRGYLKVTKDGETFISYADYNSSYARSLATIANALKNDSTQQALYNAYKSIIDRWAGFLPQEQ